MTLSRDERDRFFVDHPHWLPVEGRDAMRTSLRFASFADAFAFMTRIAFHAERLDHHPEWSNVYDRVEIVLTTHDAGGLTKKDLALAEAIDRLRPTG